MKQVSQGAADQSEELVVGGAALGRADQGETVLGGDGMALLQDEGQPVGGVVAIYARGRGIGKTDLAKRMGDFWRARGVQHREIGVGDRDGHIGFEKEAKVG